MKTKKPNLTLKFKDYEVPIELSKVTMLKNIKHDVIEITLLTDGTFRLIYSESLIPDIQKLDSIAIERDE